MRPALFALLGTLGLVGYSVTYWPAFAAASALYLGDRVVDYFDSLKTKPSKELHELIADVAALQKELADSKNAISSLSMAASLKPQAPRKPFAR